MQPDPAQQCTIDCSTLKAMELRRRYPAEASSHRNMLQRAPKQGRVVHPEFLDFSSFLRHVGPRPCRGATLDRIDNNDPEYAPGKVRWADKRTQNNNKGDTLLFYYSRTGDTYTVSRIAKLQNVAPATIRKRKERGWSDDENIEGQRAAPTPSGSPMPKPSRTRSTSPGAHHPTPVREQPISDAERRFRENARDAERYRREHGEEYCLPPLAMINEFAAECAIPVPPVSQEAYDRKFAKWWDDWWPHVFVDKLSEEAQETLSRLRDRIGPFKARHSATQGETDIAALYRWYLAVNWEPKHQQNKVLPRALSNQRPPDPEDNKSNFPLSDTLEKEGVV
ncbi:hypothetical protein ABIF96_006523 [Bradyrhizobium ottawaense]|uniref:hypothetical protein n=1 Tax=Bradyrhizobium ottawaense TaxID=931866 RepID=UPI001BA679D7|nr:hypothetical protein [Bradyrhizobium ottawaense]MBR1362811.1 hypothetical protein [Bradyrhizobium ottawaense]